jgi:hypothetical protein
VPAGQTTAAERHMTSGHRRSRRSGALWTTCGQRFGGARFVGQAGAKLKRERGTMSEAAEHIPNDIPDRVTRLEHEMAEVRFLATKAEHDASEVKLVLHGHTGVLNAIRQDQVDQGKKIAKLEREMRNGFARVDAQARENYALLAHGQSRIVDLLTRHLRDEPEAES